MAEAEMRTAPVGGRYELFELSLLGGPVESRYRRLRPDLERLPWTSLKACDYPALLVENARRSWTLAAFQEHRTAAACAVTLKALISARAPVDLIGFACRFPLDEIVHVELCARLASELGGATPVFHDPSALIPEPQGGLSPLLRAADLVVRYFCVGEAISIPLLRGTWRAARHPLVKSVLGLIVKDEAAHGQFGWLFLDWALPFLSSEDCRHLRDVANQTIDALVDGWSKAPRRVFARAEDINALGWMESRAYFTLAQRALKEHVQQPLRARGILPSA